MENNIENEATKEFDAEMEGNIIDNISNRMMELLGQIEGFVSSLQDETPSTEPAAQRRNVSRRLENAVRLLTLARNEVSAEVDGCYLFGLGDVERKDLLEQLQDSIIEKQSYSNDELEVIKSHIDDCIKLNNVQSEMSRVMDFISAQKELIRAQGVNKSGSEDEEDSESAMARVDSGICSSQTEDCAAGGGHVLEVQDVGDLPPVDEVDQLIRETAVNVSKIAMDGNEVSEETYKIDNNNDEEENDGGREKNDFDETEKSDLSKEGEEENLNVATGLRFNAADSSCSESATEDETEPETPSDGELADQTHMGNKNVCGISKPSTILQEHLMRDGISVEYYQENSEGSNRSNTSRYNYRCRVLNMEAKGEGRNRAVAKLHVAVNMLSLLTSRQADGTLPSAITPFTPAQLKGLRPILRAEVDSSAINFLRNECRRVGEKMPCFRTLSHGGPSGEQIVTVQCSALNYTAVGCGRNKRGARRDAANEIVNQHFKTAVDQEKEV